MKDAVRFAGAALLPWARGALRLSLPLAAAAGCGEKEPVLIGFAGGLSGRVADLGISGRNGVIMAVEERNEAGGMKGRTVRLVVRDDEQDPGTALRVDREMIGLGVEAIVGHMTSAMSEAAVPLMNETGTVMVSPTTTTTYLTGLDDFFIRVSATTREYASRMAGHLRTKRGIETVSVVIQVAAFRLSGKRVLKMAPLHHHFELLGWPEPKIIVRFWIIAVIRALLSLTTLKLR